MTSNNLRNNSKRFWTPLRLALTAVVLSLIAIGGISSCTSGDEKSSSVTPANPTPAGRVPEPPAVANNEPAALPSLPVNILDIKMKTVDGGTMKLGDYSGVVGAAMNSFPGAA